MTLHDKPHLPGRVVSAMRCLLGSVATGTVALAASPALAEQPSTVADADTAGPVSVAIDLGVGAPAGYFGGHLEVRVLPELGISVHGGYGASGVQVGASLRGYLYTEPGVGPFDVSFVLDAAYSAGFKGDGDTHEFREGTWHWAHLGIGAVFQPANHAPGFMFGSFVGASMLLGGPGDGSAHIDLGDMTLMTVSPGGLVGPWLQLSLGWVF